MRKKESQDVWERRVARWKKSGLSCEAFADREGVRPTTLAWWRSELRRRAKAKGGFIELASVVVADGQLGSTSPAVASVTPFFGHVSSVAAGANRAVGVAWHSASAPEFDFQASFRILDSFTGRRRSVRVPG